MPQLSKVRIVNFSYNGGKRLIADELYDFSDHEQKTGLNTLFNMENGTGKSVLVQLMLQPIIPKAKVGGRRIESFFHVPRVPCFVVLEWIKDNSTEKLITGIVIEGREASDSDEDDARGKSVRYYTFYANYADYSTSYDIVNLPLSRKEKGLFVAADFGSIRTLAKKSNGVLNCYASDESTQWHKKLAEYRLSPNEWRMIEKLNQKEDGLGNFFEDFKSSDDLIDKLLIPTIEEKLTQAQTKDDYSLARMLLSYAEQYASQRDVLHEKELLLQFAEHLRQIQPDADALWNVHDAFQRSVQTLFAFSGALQAEREIIQAKKEDCRQQMMRLDAQKHRIAWEKVSAAYHSRKAELDAAEEALAEATDAERIARSKLDAARLWKEILECAGLYQDIRKLEQEIHALNTEIQQREQGGSAAQALAELKYSLHCAASEAAQNNAKTLAAHTDVLAQVADEVKRCQHSLQNAQDAEQHCKDACIRLSGRLDSKQEQTDRSMQQLGIEMARDLYGFYAAAELRAVRDRKEQERQKCVAKIEQIRKKQEKNDKKLQELPEKQLAVKQRLWEYEREEDHIHTEMDTYRQKEATVLEICNQYQMDPLRRFNGGITDELTSIQKQNMSQKSELDRRKQILQEEIEAVQHGTLHVPQAVISYLNSTGVRYTTCEKYLLDSVKNGDLTPDECAEILRKYPAVAYGVLMDEPAKQKFFAFGRERWLPAMIPLYSYGQMDQIMKAQREFRGAIAFYAEDYFANPAHYLEQLEINRDATLQEEKRRIAEGEVLQRQIKAAQDFSYDAKWLQNQQVAQERLNRQIQQQKTLMQSYADDKVRLQQEKKDLETQMEQAKQIWTQLDHWLDRCEELMQHLNDEERIAAELREARQQKKQAETALQHCKAAQEQADRQFHDATAYMENLKQLESELQMILCSTAGCPETKVRAGSWQELHVQYQQLQHSANEELQSLVRQRDASTQKQQNLRMKLDFYPLDQTQYCDVSYSWDAVRQAIEAQTQCEQIQQQLQKNKETALEHKGVAEGRYQTAAAELSVFGEALPPAEIGANFAARIAQIEQERATQTELDDTLRKCENKINRTLARLEDALRAYPSPVEWNVSVALSENIEAQYTDLLRQRDQQKKQLDTIQSALERALQNMQEQFRNTNLGISEAIRSMSDLLQKAGAGDSYYTLISHIAENIKNARREISRIETDLQDLDNMHTDLVRQCVLQGQRIYDGLKQMAASSRVTVYEGKEKKQMLRFDIPAEVDPMVAETAIRNEIDFGTRELVAKMNSASCTEAELSNLAKRLAGSPNLLRKYIGKENIRVDAYKIDQSAQNAGYRSWRDTRINNSGAEKFVVYFTLVLSIMNYARSEIGGVRDKDLYSALILDNPFGATSSRHILKPMFEIASHFRVQLICFAHINETEVFNRFDIVIRAIVKRRPMSSHELLTHEGNERIEHGFYRTEQISLY